MHAYARFNNHVSIFEVKWATRSGNGHLIHLAHHVLASLQQAFIKSRPSYARLDDSTPPGCITCCDREQAPRCISLQISLILCRQINNNVHRTNPEGSCVPTQPHQSRRIDSLLWVRALYLSVPFLSIFCSPVGLSAFSSLRRPTNGEIALPALPALLAFGAAQFSHLLLSLAVPANSSKRSSQCREAPPEAALVAAAPAARTTMPMASRCKASSRSIRITA